MFAFVPELQDGISSHSLLQSLFGVFGDSGWSHAKFFFAFEKSIWVTFITLIANFVVYVVGKGKQKT